MTPSAFVDVCTASQRVVLTNVFLIVALVAVAATRQHILVRRGITVGREESWCNAMDLRLT